MSCRGANATTCRASDRVLSTCATAAIWDPARVFRRAAGLPGWLPGRRGVLSFVMASAGDFGAGYRRQFPCGIRR